MACGIALYACPGFLWGAGGPRPFRFILDQTCRPDFALLLIAACAYGAGASGIFVLSIGNAPRSANEGPQKRQKTMKNRRELLRAPQCGHEMDLLGLGDLAQPSR